MHVLLASISSLEKLDKSCARLSVWHSRAYVVGVQTALHTLNVDAYQDALELGNFGAKLHEKYGGLGSEYDAVWRRTTSPKESADVFLEEWKSFLKERGIAATERAPRNLEGVIDLNVVLPSIRARPRLYFITPDISFLRAWFDGIRFVSEYFGGVRILPDIDAFEQWLRQQSAPDASCPWDMILTSVCGGDSSLAFTKVFEELRRFAQVGQQP